MASIEDINHHQPLIIVGENHSSSSYVATAWEYNNLSSDTVEEILAGRSHNHPISIEGWMKLIAWESRVLWYLSGATIIVSLFTFMQTTATLMFTGHLGSLPLAGASIACIGIQGLTYGIMVLCCNILFNFRFILICF